MVGDERLSAVGGLLQHYNRQDGICSLTNSHLVLVYEHYIIHSKLLQAIFSRLVLIKMCQLVITDEARNRGNTDLFNDMCGSAHEKAPNLSSNLLWNQ